MIKYQKTLLNPALLLIFNISCSSFGNTASTKVGTSVLASNTYNAKNGALNAVTYGNGDKKSYKYDKLGNVTAIYKNTDSSPAYAWQYNAGGTPLSHTDSINNLKYSYTYDSIDRFIRQKITTISGAEIGATEFGYDERNNINKIINQIGGRTYTQNYSCSTVSENADSSDYTKDNLPTLYKLSTDKYAVYSYDALNRLSQRKFTTTSPLYNHYIYKQSQRNSTGESKYQTTLLGTEFIANDAYSYTYDKAGNITAITKGVRKSTDSASSDFKTVDQETAYRSYEYDALGQLTRENNAVTNTTKAYTYDALGNIVSIKEYPYTTEALEEEERTIAYTYGKDGKNGWNNLLVGVDLDANGELSAEESITYDAIGNPTTYLGAQLSWNARQLEGYSNAENTISYTYDSDGLRASKTVNGAKTIYQYVDSSLYYQCTYTPSGAVDTELYFFYDSYGNLACIRCFTQDNEYTYYTTTNIQGDVLGIYDPQGNIVASYEYDTWGNILSTTDSSPISISRLNPIRYRGYYFDIETSLYYLQSRYYNPQIGRFLNADSLINQIIILGNNMFAYCLNNPITLTDNTGKLPFIAVTASIGAVAGGIAGGIIASKSGGNIWAGIGIGAIAGGLTGAGLGAGAGIILAGSATASVTSVAIGTKALFSTVGSAGISAGVKLLADNVSQAFNRTPQVFWSGGNVAKNAAKQVANKAAGKTLEMTRLGRYLEQTNAPYPAWQAASSNFANVATNSSPSIYSIQNITGVGLQSTWATIEYPLLQSRDIVFGVASQNGSIQIIP